MKKITHENKVVGYVHDETLVIDETAFNALAAQIRSAILVANPAKNYDFRKDLSEITNGRKVLERLKAGEDVSLELAFHEVELPRNFAEIYKQYQEAVQQVSEALAKAIPPYPFAQGPAKGETPLELTGANDRYVTNGQYKCSVMLARKIWKKVAPWWGGFTEKKPDPSYQEISGYSRSIIYYRERIEIGCQKISRWQVEQLALELGWDFPSAA